MGLSGKHCEILPEGTNASNETNSTIEEGSQDLSVVSLGSLPGNATEPNNGENETE